MQITKPIVNMMMDSWYIYENYTSPFGLSAIDDNCADRKQCFKLPNGMLEDHNSTNISVFGLQQPTFDFTGGDFSIQKVEDDGTSVPTATYADDNFSFPSTVAFGTSTSTPKIQFGKVNTPGGDRSGNTTNNNSDNNNNNSNNQLSFGSGPSTSGNSSNPMLNPVSTETTDLQTQLTEANTSKTAFNKTNINSPSIITPVKQDIAINNDNNDGGTTSMMMPTTTTTTSSTTTTTASINNKDANDNKKEEEETEENEDDLEMLNDDGSDNNRCPAYLSEKQFESYLDNAS